MNKLYFGDNLDVLREKIKDESVDLIYLDPPFNSNATYNVLFKTKTGQASEAQAQAFCDTWEWGDQARDAYEDVMRMNGDIALVLSGFRKWMGQNAMMAYLAMMSARLAELRRVLKPNGSIYLHCDPTASHYLKILLDAVFGHRSFRNEIVWQRNTSHNSARRYGRIHDALLFYTNSDDFTWNPQFTDYSKEQLSRYELDDEQRAFKGENLTAERRNSSSGKFRWRGTMPGPTRGWAYPVEQLEEWWEEGRILTKLDPRLDGLKVYLDDLPGKPLQDVWTDIPRIANTSAERLGFPTQKPLALLERVIRSSSNEGDVILDPFCGCGTTVAAAEKLKRQWLGIDVTHYAVTLIERRLKAAGISASAFQVAGRPTDIAGARDLAQRDKHQFQWWAAWRLGARWYREEKKGADRGIDGRMLFKNGPYGDGMIILSVKGGENIGVKDVRDLRGVIEREDAEMGVLVSLASPTGPMMTEAAAAGYVPKSAHGRLPRLQVVTIEEILDGHLPKFPPLPQPEHLPMRAGRKRETDQLELLLPFAGNKVAPAKGDFIDPSIMNFG